MPPIKSSYISSLDGVRALAVIAVIIYHMNPAWAPSGLLGVTIFFVLSGYLITSLLIIEFNNNKTIDLPAFWMRRVKRLVPAIIFVIVTTAALCALFNHVLLTKMRPDIIPSLFFFNNWWQIIHEVSYFEALGSPSPLTHFWSLAIEEQFYLVWPVLLLFIFRSKVRFRNIRRGILVATAISALLMAFLYDPNADPSRVYYGTDTRAFSLLIGAWLAFAWPAWKLSGKQREDFEPGIRIALDAFGIACLLGVVAIVMTVDGFSPFIYRGGILLTSILTAGVLAVIVHPASLLARFLSIAPLNWCGLRSYGIYLWHYPILLLMNPPGTHPTWWMALIEIALIFGISEFSYRFVENPVRKGKFHPFLDQFAEAADKRVRALRYTPVAAIVLVVAISGAGIALVPDTAAVNNVDTMKQQQQEVDEAKEKAVQEAENAAENEKAFDVLLIGDSVSLAALSNFQDTFPYGCIDSAVSRQFSQADQIYDYYAEKDLVGKIVVLALGTNGTVDKKDLEALLDKIGPDRKIFLINTKSGESWESKVNSLYAKEADARDNVELIDWYAKCQQKANIFEPDNIHLNASGAKYYNTMIKNAVKADLPERSADALKKGKKKSASSSASEESSSSSANTADSAGQGTDQDGEGANEGEDNA